MTKISILLIWSSTIICINSQYSLEHSSETIEACGHKLASIVSFLCNQRYFTPKFKKSSLEDLSAVGMTSHDLMSEYEKYLKLFEVKGRDSNDRHYGALSFPFKARSDAFGITANRFRRQTNQIVDECCHKACEIKEMLGYCE